MNRLLKKTAQFTNLILFPVIIFICWWLVTEWEYFPAVILPPMEAVAASFLRQLESGQLFQDVLVSLIRVAKGFSIAAMLGIFLGLLMGVSETINRFFILPLNSIRQIPIIAWIPLIILWCGIGELSKVVIIVLGAFFPVLVNTIFGITQVPKDYIEVGRLFRLSRWKMFTQIYLPSAIPAIFEGLKLGLSNSWTVVVAAEIIAASSGIGYRINDARSLMQSEVVIVGILIIGLIGLALDQIFVWGAKLLTPWAHTK
jgi:sulfonate transport system permease protein